MTVLVLLLFLLGLLFNGIYHLLGSAGMPGPWRRAFCAALLTDLLQHLLAIPAPVLLQLVVFCASLLVSDPLHQLLRRKQS